MVSAMLEMLGLPCTTPGTSGTTSGDFDCCDPVNTMLCGLMGLSCTGGTTEGTIGTTIDGLDCSDPTEVAFWEMFGMPCTTSGTGVTAWTGTN